MAACVFSYMFYVNDSKVLDAQDGKSSTGITGE